MCSAYCIWVISPDLYLTYPLFVTQIQNSVQLHQSNVLHISDLKRHPIFQCMNDLMIPNYEGVAECYSSVYGKNLFYRNSWEFRNGLEPRPFGVPWVTFNGSWKEEESNNNLRQVLCTKYLKNVPECNQNN